MKPNCIKCGAEIPAENVNPDRMVAQCPVCHSVFHFESEFTDGRISAAVKRAEVARPENVLIEKGSGVLTIRWRWLNSTILLWTVFALFWNTITISLLGVMVAGILEGDFKGAFSYSFLPMGFGLFLVYYVLAGYMNETKVIVDGQTIRIQHSPLPWGSERAIDGSVVQLYIKKRHWAIIGSAITTCMPFPARADTRCYSLAWKG